jgi:hypothetical protein
MTDEQWIELGRVASLADYMEAFENAFGLDLRT